MNINTEPTLAQLLKSAQSELKISSTPRLDAWVLLSFATKRPRHWLVANSSQKASDTMSSDALSYFDYLVKIRSLGTPISLIIGSKEFYGIDFYVNKYTLTPRPESEAIVQEVINSAPKNSKLLDVGTGAGAIAISVAIHRPDLDIFACDNSPKALEVARKNALHHQVDIKIQSSDLISLYKSDSFQIITANLPYLPDSYSNKPDLQFEPTGALFGGADGLDIYRRLFEQLKDASSSTVITEHLPSQKDAMDIIASTNHLQFVKSLSDFCSVYSATQ